MSYVYKIILKPKGSFYFGGEESFSKSDLEAVVSKDKKAKDYFKKRQGYFAKSEKFPQQTQLLGMLRYELLKKEKKIFYFKNFITVPANHKQDAKDLVGKSKWSPKDKLDLGIIQRLSHLYLYNADKKKLFLPTPKDINLTLIEKEKGYINGRETKAYAFLKCDKPDSYFGAKDYLSSAFIDCDKNTLDLDSIYTSQVTTHTQTNNYKDDNEDALFKVKKYHLDKQYAFVFFVELAKEIFKEPYSTTVKLGGEESYFDMTVEKDDVEAFDIPQSKFSFLKKPTERIVLLSDTFVDAKDDIFSYTKVALCGKKVLRVMENSVKKEKHYKEHFKKSTKKVLLEKGSVFYPKDENARKKIEDILSNYTNFKTIGYNSYLTLKGE